MNFHPGFISISRLHQQRRDKKHALAKDRLAVINLDTQTAKSFFLRFFFHEHNENPGINKRLRPLAKTKKVARLFFSYSTVFIVRG